MFWVWVSDCSQNSLYLFRTNHCLQHWYEFATQTVLLSRGTQVCIIDFAMVIILILEIWRTCLIPVLGGGMGWGGVGSGEAPQFPPWELPTTNSQLKCWFAVWLEKLSSLFVLKQHWRKCVNQINNINTIQMCCLSFIGGFVSRKWKNSDCCRGKKG